MFLLVLFAMALNFVFTLVEALIVKWVGPHTGIGYFDSASYWNIFFFVLLVNMVLGLSNVTSSE